jgi:hypothetical protein
VLLSLYAVTAKGNLYVSGENSSPLGEDFSLINLLDENYRKTSQYIENQDKAKYVAKSPLEFRSISAIFEVQ